MVLDSIGHGVGCQNSSYARFSFSRDLVVLPDPLICEIC